MRLWHRVHGIFRTSHSMPSLQCERWPGCTSRYTLHRSHLRHSLSPGLIDRLMAAAPSHASPAGLRRRHASGRQLPNTKLTLKNAFDNGWSGLLPRFASHETLPRGVRPGWGHGAQRLTFQSPMRFLRSTMSDTFQGPPRSVLPRACPCPICSTVVSRMRRDQKEN
jgi:hypothetical protein